MGEIFSGYAPDTCLMPSQNAVVICGYFSESEDILRNMRLERCAFELKEREYVDLHLNSKVDQINFYSVKLQSK